MKAIPLLIAALLPAGALAQTAADSAAIEATAHNYVDGYYEGIVEFADMPGYFEELEAFIDQVEGAESPDGVEG